jgi:hypothetical protein
MQSIRALACYAKKIKKACELMKAAKTTRTQKVSADYGAASHRFQPNSHVQRDHHC